MAFSATINEFFKGGPKNIKRRLLRDILIILFITIGGILTIVSIQGIKTQRDISEAIIHDANRLVSKRFNSFTAPLTTMVKLLAKFGEAGLLNIKDPARLATQFQVLMEIEPHITSISIADTLSREVRLVRSEDRWLLDEYSPEKHTRSIWKNHTISDSSTTANKAYNPSQTSWFRGALTTYTTDTFFYTDAHSLPESEETGIFASIRWKKQDSDDAPSVSAISFTLRSLLVFMEQMELTPNNKILILQKNGTVLSNQRYNNKFSEKGIDEQSTRVSTSLFDAVIQKLKSATLQSNQVSAIKDKGQTWWLGLTPLQEESQDVWVAILIPDDDVFTNLRRQWLNFAILAGSILLGATIMTILLVRRYSHQLKDLPQQHINSQGFENEVFALIRAGESTTLEFKSTMRTNLKTGKPGKEIELAWLKTVAGFMNSDGGILLIGIEDDGKLLGIEIDNFANEDKCRLHFKNLLNTHIGAEFTRFIHLKIVTIREKTILIVECERVRRPVFLRVGKNEDFFIRSGPSSTKLTMSQLVKYLAER